MVHQSDPSVVSAGCHEPLGKLSAKIDVHATPAPLPTFRTFLSILQARVATTLSEVTLSAGVGHTVGDTGRHNSMREGGLPCAGWRNINKIYQSQLQYTDFSDRRVIDPPKPQFQSNLSREVFFIFYSSFRIGPHLIRASFPRLFKHSSLSPGNNAADFEMTGSTDERCWFAV